MSAPCPQCHEYERQRFAEYMAHEATKRELEQYKKPSWHRLPQNLWLFQNVKTELLVLVMQRFEGRDLRIHETNRSATMFLRSARAGEEPDQIDRWMQIHI